LKAINIKQKKVKKAWWVQKLALRNPLLFSR